MNSLSTRNLW